MEIIRVEESHVIQNGKSCEATEYLTSSQNLNIARIKVSGRFPETGVMWNSEVEEVVYVESGEGLVSINGNSHSIKQGDVILYQKGEKVFWDGIMILITACTPAWRPKQHVIAG